MKLTEIFKHKTVFSFEVFPPHGEAPVDKIRKTLTNLEHIHPDFISVTLGAGGIGAQNQTVGIANFIQNDLNIPAVAHIPGLYQSKEDVRKLLAELSGHHISNILALRGDKIAGRTPVGDFNHANELVSFIKEQPGDFQLMGACYPQCHQEAANLIEDIANLKRKVDAGADHLISQLFYENQCFYDFMDQTRSAGISVPIEAGIMPVTNKSQIERMAKISGKPLPEKFAAILNHYADNKEALRDAGIAYAIDQIVDLVAHGVDGIHLYTMNHSKVAQRIWDATASLFKDSEEKPSVHL
ncbi:5,10-methylenetetrahydrofolate reductase [Pediococcus damnosus]|uniref:Methylenetetrahydrofolate reductase n=1 Tax=Pediococcus damnosus TaxID=51663 RepID=A0A0R2HJD5_9LACO|nr:methylenetetrahydrofolate reductase [NAD(P)H] [Pediococcus damnosus]AMV63014.1 5,10-methylenetetrahydrofolate reductase [Pediococcus damnosus]AMV67099.1 5,10-methylenetetrahydrofolate reductase [Pediococcus damnosus]KRN51830.1 5,10-methylenetetrahydrofolate reductase [Pediococcus damnosus]PJE49416.1 methylenetetrahydrofolate reductase [NAD(P)H] [Pediococcus damnosus]